MVRCLYNPLCRWRVGVKKSNADQRVVQRVVQRADQDSTADCSCAADPDSSVIEPPLRRNQKNQLIGMLGGGGDRLIAGFSNPGTSRPVPHLYHPTSSGVIRRRLSSPSESPAKTTSAETMDTGDSGQRVLCDPVSGTIEVCAALPRDQANMTLEAAPRRSVGRQAGPSHNCRICGRIYERADHRKISCSLSFRSANSRDSQSP